MNHATTTQDMIVHSHDALEAALLAALGCYDLSPDIKGLLARLPRSDGRIREDDILPLCAKLGVSIATGHVTTTALKSFGKPAIILFEDGGVAAFLPTTAGGEFKSFATPMAIEGKIRQSYALLPPTPDSKMDTSHMKSWHALDWFWEPVRRYTKQYWEILVVSTFINILTIAMPIYTMNIYDRVTVNFANSTLIVLSVGIVIVLLFDFMFRTMRAYVLELIATRVGQKYDMDLMQRFLTIKSSAMRLSVGERTNLFRELQGIKDFYATRLMPSLVDVPFFFLFIGVIWSISPAVAFVPIVGAVLIILITRALQVPVNRSTEELFKGVQNKSALLVQTLAGTETVRMLGATGHQLFQWSTVSEHYANINRHSSLLTTLVMNLCILMSSLVTVFVLIVGVYQIAQGLGQMTVGALVACSLLAGRAIAPIIGLSGLIARLKQSSDVLKAIDKVFALPHDEDAMMTKSAKNITQGSIEFHDVTFAYPGQPRPALQKISLTIKAGERVGIIGRTGAGKSTLARLITSFIEPVIGTMFIGGYAMDTISPEELHRTIGYVPQDGTFFSGSVRSNILLGAHDVDEAALQNALQVSGLSSILQSIGAGLDMEVGEGGKNLSGGQKQALALARALVRNPAIMVFDEPVNGIDNSLEAIIRSGLQTYLHNRTFVMITHRTSLLSLVDRLIVLEGGMVVGDGPRDEILAKLGGGSK